MQGYVIPLALSALCMLADSARAQQPTVRRADTLGANFDHTQVGTGTPNDFDFLVGTWEYVFQTRKREAPGEYETAWPGTWTARKTHDGLIVEDVFSTRPPTGERGNTVTYRVFNPQRKVWEIQGVRARQGVWLPGTAWSDGKDRFLVQNYPDQGMLMRIRYYDISNEHFLWRADGSRDGGKTWTKDVWLIEATRTAP
jgi:hypothetical protein